MRLLFALLFLNFSCLHLSGQHLELRKDMMESILFIHNVDNSYLQETSSIGVGTDYYCNIGSETCEELKTILHDLIDDHTVVTYSSLWTHYQVTDDHLNDSGTETIVWDMYSDNPTGSENEFTFVTEQCGNYQSEGDCYNREHSFPKSWWGGSSSVPQYTDIFVVVPSDGWVNGLRSNFPYGEILPGTTPQTTNNGTALGTSAVSIPGYTGSVFEPIDAYKGDLARGYFYLATRYQDVISSWQNNSNEANAVLDGSTYLVFEQWMIDMLISWHNLDPVDSKELDRNDAIYAIQGNRNPFIDHPEYVNLIWGNCNGPVCTPIITMNNTIPSGLYHADQSVFSDGNVVSPTIVDFKAGLEIVLNSGFEVNLGAEFTAIIEDCTAP